MIGVGVCRWTAEEVRHARNVCHSYISRIDCMNLDELTNEFIRVYRFEPHMGRADYLRRVLELHAIRVELLNHAATGSGEDDFPLPSDRWSVSGAH